MRNKAGLVFVFNHKFEKNIARLEEYYGERFSSRTYLMPFSSLTDPKVVSVVENGRTFSGHIAQGKHAYCQPDVSHYVFLADDLILNPKLNEESLIDQLELTASSGYTKSMVSADSIRFHWPHSITAKRALEKPFFDFESELPDAVAAEKKIRSLGLSLERPWPRTRQDLRWMLVTFPFVMSSLWLPNLLSIGVASKYPLVSGYSDFVIVPCDAVEKFAHYCGVFAAMDIFAEIAVPTALALACKDIRTELPLGAHFMDNPRTNQERRWKGIELWVKEIEQFAVSRGYNWAELIGEFPEDALYVHPIKLSQWR